MTREKTKMLVTLGLLIAAQVVLSRFCSIAAWNFKLGFGFVPIVVAALLYGPVASATVAGVSDLLGAVLFPIGAFFPGYTLTAVLRGVIYGVFLYKKPTLPRTAAAVLLTQGLLSLLLNSFWISFTSGSPYGPLVWTRLAQCAIAAPVEFAVTVALAKSHALLQKRVSQ